MPTRQKSSFFKDSSELIDEFQTFDFLLVQNHATLTTNLYITTDID